MTAVLTCGSYIRKSSTMTMPTSYYRPLDGVIVALASATGESKEIRRPERCREHDVPTFGICLGMQCMVIEFARNVLGLPQANSTEMNPTTPDNVIDLMEDREKHIEHGWDNAVRRLRLRADTRLDTGTSLYGRTDRQRTPPSPIRIQRPLPCQVRRGRDEMYRRKPPTPIWSKWLKSR